MNSIYSLLFALLVLVCAVALFLKICIRVQRDGGSIPYFISSGAMDSTLDNEKKAATTVIVECNANKKMEDQSSFDPPEKTKLNNISIKLL